MNPATRKNPLDSAKYREQYLSNLRLQASNNQLNMNANMIYKNTGQTPSRPPDMRTTTERAGDIEALKVDLRSKLGTITDGVIASQIIGELDQYQIRFAVDNWEIITGDMRKMFATGVPTSAFVAYLNRLIYKYQITDGVETGLQQSSGNAILLSNTQLLYGLPREQIWTALDNVLSRIQSGGINVSEVRDRMKETASLIPTRAEQDLVATLPFNRRAEVMDLATQIYNNFPSNTAISDIIGELNIGLANRDKRYTEKVLGDLNDLITTDPSVLDQMAELRGIMADIVAEREGNRLREGATEEYETGFTFEDDEIPDGNVNPTQPSFSTIEEVVGNIGKKPPKKVVESPVEVPQKIAREQWDALGAKKRQQKADFLNTRLAFNPDLSLRDTKGREYGVENDKFFSPTKNTNADLNTAYDEYMVVSEEGSIGSGIKKSAVIVEKPKSRMNGRGLRPKIEKPYRQSIAHLVDKPIDKPKPYTPFGRYYINKHRLEGEGIIAFRQPSGNTIHTLPTEKISKTLAKVMKTLVGKGIPSYEDIGELTKAEQNKLHHICKVCQINNPAVPKMKGAGEQEDDRFEILRGEIIAGNDNAKIAKEFKVMLMKFMNEGRIPRRQANEILQELLALGH